MCASPPLEVATGPKRTFSSPPGGQEEGEEREKAPRHLFFLLFCFGMRVETKNIKKKQVAKKKVWKTQPGSC